MRAKSSWKDQPTKWKGGEVPKTSVGSAGSRTTIVELIFRTVDEVGKTKVHSTTVIKGSHMVATEPSCKEEMQGGVQEWNSGMVAASVVSRWEHEWKGGGAATHHQRRLPNLLQDNLSTSQSRICTCEPHSGRHQGEHSSCAVTPSGHFIREQTCHINSIFWRRRGVSVRECVGGWVDVRVSVHYQTHRCTTPSSSQTHRAPISFCTDAKESQYSQSGLWSDWRDMETGRGGMYCAKKICTHPGSKRGTFPRKHSQHWDLSREWWCPFSKILQLEG